MKKNKILTLTFLCGGIVALSVPAVLNSVHKTVSVKAAESVTVTLTDIAWSSGATSSQMSSYVFFTLPENNIAVPANEGVLRFKATAASNTLVVTRADGTTESHNVNLCKQTTTRYYVQFDDWANDQFTVGVGDCLTLNGTATNANGDSLTFQNITFIHKTENTWAVKKAEHTYRYDDTNITSVQKLAYHQSTGAAGDYSYNIVSLGVDQDDDFTVNDRWDKFYEVENGATIQPAGSNEVITKNVLIYKPSQKTYGVMWMQDPGWASEYFKRTWYDFKTGDQVTINGSITCESGVNQYTTTISNIVLTWTGSSFSIYRPSVIHNAITALQNLDDQVTYTDACKAKIDAADSIVSGLSNQELADIPAALLTKLSNQKYEYKVLEATAKGKTIHENTILSQDISASQEMSGYITGCQFKVIDQTLDFPTDPVWTTFYRGFTNDAQIIRSDGTIEKATTAIVISQGEEDKIYRGTFIFVNFGSKLDTSNNFYAGDRYVVSETKYTAETDTDLYVIHFEGGDFMWTGDNADSTGFWINTESCPNLPDLANKINAIGEVTYTPECKAKIDAARSVYDAMSDDELKWVSASTTTALEKAESDYQNLKEETETKNVIALIDDIGEVTYTPECKAKIDAARSAYDASSSVVKERIPTEKLTILTDAEAKYIDLGNEKAAAEVVVKIKAIGEVTYTAECKSKIDEARAAYSNLSEAAQDKISDEDYQILTDAETKYTSLKAVDDFKNVVNSLNSQSTLDQIYSASLAAQNYYSKITDKSSVSAELATLKTYMDKYNSAVNAMNEAHEDGSEVANNLIVTALATASLLGIGLKFLSKKGLF